MSGIAHAFALATAEGIAARDFAPLARGIGGLLPAILDELADRVAEGRFRADVSNIRSAHAGMSHVIDAAEGHAIDVGVLRAAGAVTRRAIEGGHGDDDFARLAEQLVTGATGTGTG